VSGTAAETRTVTVEREIAYPAERIWRALTQPHLIAEWLMANDFAPVVGHRFGLEAEWGKLACEVLEVEPQRTLAYTWTGLGLDSVVTWTLTPSATGTHLRMVQTGFLPEQKLAYHGARAGWPRFLDRLEAVLAAQG
jgi:uncharacterized protein YndB with AHSA1/START domain